MKGLKTQEIRPGVRDILMHTLELPGQTGIKPLVSGEQGSSGEHRSRSTGHMKVSRLIS